MIRVDISCKEYSNSWGVTKLESSFASQRLFKEDDFDKVFGYLVEKKADIAKCKNCIITITRGVE